MPDPDQGSTPPSADDPPRGPIPFPTVGAARLQTGPAARGGPPSAPAASDPRPDILVIQAIRSGRTGDFEVLYRRHRDWVYRAACRFTGDPELALDVMQEVFAYLLTRLPTLELHARLTTFLYPAIRNLSIDAARRRTRAGGGSGAAAGEGADPPGPVLRPSADTSEMQAALAAAVNALPDIHREVVLLRVVDEMGVAHIAAALDIPEGTVKSRLHHALAALREDPRTRGYFGG